MKIKLWSLAVADTKWSEHIRKKGYCEMCGRKPPEVKLTCSHYWGRYAMITRFDPENCDCICLGDHFKIENAKQGFYREWKIKQLGLKRYKALEKRYYQVFKSKQDAIKELMNYLNNK